MDSGVTQIENKGLTNSQMAILQFVCAYPKPPKHADIARALKVSLSIVSQTMVDPRFKTALRQIVLATSFSAFGGVVQKITEQALEGNHPQQKLYMQLHKQSLDEPEDDPGESLGEVQAIQIKATQIEQRLKKLIQKQSVSEGQMVDHIEVETEKPPGIVVVETHLKGPNDV